MEQGSGHPHHLKQIDVEGFKSIPDASIELRPLSIIVGANSSGKSTLLQAILALSQAVRAESPDEQFPLNGEYARFGTFDETRHYCNIKADRGVDEARIRIRTKTAFPFVRPRTRRGRLQAPYEGVIDWTIELGVGERESEGTATIRRLVVHAYTVDDEQVTVDILRCDLSFESRTPSDDSIVNEMNAMFERSPHRRFLPSTLVRVNGQYSETYIPGVPIVWHGDGVELKGGIPRMLHRVRSLGDSIGSHWWAALHRFANEGRVPKSVVERDALEASRRDSSDLSDRILELAVKTADRWQESQNEDEEQFFGIPTSVELEFAIEEALQRLQDEVSSEEILGLLEAQTMRQFLVDLNYSLRDKKWASVRVLDSPEDVFWSGLRQTSQMIAQFFDTRIRYLGPLRRAPQVLYDPRKRDRDIGNSGEYTAAVLHMYSSLSVTAIGINNGSEDVELKEGVEYWLREFDMATAIKTEDRGRLGIGLRVSPYTGSRPVDLTSVGVGVSQVLPVIVLCLLSHPGDVIILEQPELHLHPRLQQKLGDFLLECALSGRQLIVETHSDHLVNRIRRRIVEGTKMAEGVVGLFFAEQIEGRTVFRESGVDAFGGIEEEWPSGFFDVSAREAQAFITTSLRKRFSKQEE